MLVTRTVRRGGQEQVVCAVDLEADANTLTREQAELAIAHIVRELTSEQVKLLSPDSPKRAIMSKYQRRIDFLETSVYVSDDGRSAIVIATRG
ncbi:hypothetical protein A3C20_00540 [Candidatus Kaiserbacteria bacterium RIFCSPHIGHO2_02_FULL_55_25]|uniref:Uncharacterized protein n=1 Tax=Candidatus Kaiserbacteria bacterium RIFCSPHIGHO2_02_FULL_55_25 TaxID=1798498 RepID=A0A1F6E4U8_9BACT|nr:MAG: hypothetical protein A2764_03470 [Candidatus Kaiserbacteria bacterium RIFCSPHIGHO2_01_FULL_55_79]OGG68661.1 MAG: hypothetical protein A3C20_00540 [Candidatus Kaiserbacteria bacterium RIFCSPHIGHO2_02_FULL_55_25]OGG78685.1 MAG: hypothetical protein A3F56_01395 [Candidatus Kaiserbacteria bacterium RIFCSPHIGHO2_12_FULL_55_13]OGG83032.1 MAG: hypothetical protein A3A42_01500 [Candidatus Kaiserbacteria bacterium RIFCSPLOWO2_01_FULL_55_25]